MKKVKQFFASLRTKPVRIRGQMYMFYGFALLIPLTIIGLLLLNAGGNLLEEHCIELLEADNLRVKTLVSEITTNAYAVSEEILYDNDLKTLLTEQYDAYSDFIGAVNRHSTLDTLIYNNQEIGNIYIYTDNPTVRNYKQFRPEPQELPAWYTVTLQNSGALWFSMAEEAYGNDLSNLCLARRVVLPESDYQAVLVIRINDSYIRSRIDSASLVDAISVDGGGIVYSTKRAWYGEPQPVEIDRSQSYYRYSGQTKVEGIQYFATVSTVHLYKTNCKMYITTMDSSGFASSRTLIRSWAVLLAVAMLVPGVMLVIFANYFSSRVRRLREQMYKARSQDYNMDAAMGGRDELTEAYEDLKAMVQDIKEKDAKMYEAELNAKELRSNQQAIEYKMLASQINPHYLYNTLETIRMKALSGGNREVADSVKILARTMRYVQDNTGTAFTTLQRELDHAGDYLAIQKLRFGERINHTVTVQPGLDTTQYKMLPLLLQPLVENAVVHGLEAMDGVGRITIEITRDDTYLKIAVSNNGLGMDAQELETVRRRLEAEEADPRAGIALYNINRRICLLCGDAYGLQIQSVPGSQTCVTLFLPADSTNISF